MRKVVAVVSPSLLLAVLVAAAMAIANAPLELDRPLVVTGVLWLGAVAFAAGLAFSLGLARERVGLRLVMLAPLVLSVGLVVVLVLEVHHRAAGVVGP
jgi:FtsH-binding integral membrane protein